MARKCIMAIALLGIVIFGTAFLISFFKPVLIERSARAVIRIEIERRVGEKIESLSNTRIIALTQKALRKTDEEIRAAKDELKKDLGKKAAAIVSDMLDPECECRKRLLERSIQNDEDQINSPSLLIKKLSSMIESTYVIVTQNLLREFRIFTGSNAAAFGALAAFAYFKRGASLQLLVPSVVITVAVVVVAGFYIFGQDWIHSIIYSDYVGLAYSFYLLLTTALFGDILMNRARVTTEIFNVIADVLGSTLQATAG